ncbi:potassium-transporting ATPase subunit A [Microcystis wesenbergii FACHB-1317]|uniref:potassium-transporting ATPase subunit KdpA n=1 Tax=Microcystis TaxID=1125 RepID=UPI0016810ED6|nr:MULTISPECIES: potassium-transporting ATPase subunit KdpA [Microcystis]MBD2288422.1 potassium-transporting ATPase subunit A [Microcystis wesenbergii FACHB-1317]UZO78560.1 potassium-transporting ATPase subunit KdpA [Microcystis aeruginosa str. Chao 1910]
MLQGWIQIALTILIIVAITPFFGRYMARVFMERRTLLDPLCDRAESLLYTFVGVKGKENMIGWQYARAVLYSNAVIAVLVFSLIAGQGVLPLNPTGIPAPTWDTTLHTAISFITNTDQQHYSGETTLSYGSQIWGLGYQMFTSAGTGLAVGIAFIRGLTGRPLGNFYVDLIRAITRILLPISIVGAITLIIAGVPETLAGPAILPTLENPNLSQAIARGPVAHFEIIKELGENGGGFFASNSAHPFENPNGFVNLVQLVAILSIPTSLIYTYGVFADNLKQARLIYLIPLGIFIGFTIITAIGEYNGNQAVNSLLGVERAVNFEGKEVRFGWAQSALYAVTTTATMCGAVIAMHDSLMPNGGFATLSNLFLQIVFGGQGTGTAYLFAYLILAVFVTGLMVGRTPEFLGRKIEKREVVLASFLILLVHPIAILIPGAIALAIPDFQGISNPGFHGLSQVIYEYASAAANNGSGFEGLGDSQPAPLAIAAGAKPTITALWWNLSASFSLLAGRYIPIAALLFLADGMSRKQPVPATTGTLRTDTGLFTGVTAGVILILGALTFLPILALGPIAEAFQITRMIG